MHDSCCDRSRWRSRAVSTGHLNTITFSLDRWRSTYPERRRRPAGGRYRSGMAAERRANKANPTRERRMAAKRRAKKATPTPERQCPVCPSCGFFPETLTSTGLLPLHNTARGGRCHGTDEKPVGAVVPPWLKPGKYAPAFGTRARGIRNAPPPPRTSGTHTPKLTERTDLPDSRVDTDRVRQPGTVSGGAPTLGRRR